MELRITLLNKTIQIQIDKYSVFFHMWNVDLSVYRETKKRTMRMKILRGGWGGINGKIEHQLVIN